MKKLLTVFITLIIAISCICVPVFALDTRPGTFFTDAQVSASAQIKEKYDIDVILLYSEKNETGSLSDYTHTYLAENNITSRYFVFALNDEYYYYNWSTDLADIFHSVDGTYILNSIAYDDNDNHLPLSEIEDNYFALIQQMLENRLVCPYKYIKDHAGVLTDSQEKELNDKLLSFKENNNFDMVVVLTNGIDNGTVYNDDRMTYADDYYDYNGYAKDGILLLVNIGPNEKYTRNNSYISTAGKCINLIDDDDISDIGHDLTAKLENGMFFEAADMFPDLVAKIIKSDKIGGYSTLGLITLVLCIIVAFVYCGRLKRQLKSVDFADDADDYVVADSLNISRSYDHFLYAHVSRTEKASSSGSSSHTSSSGTSHGGGGF